MSLKQVPLYVASGERSGQEEKEQKVQDVGEDAQRPGLWAFSLFLETNRSQEFFPKLDGNSQTRT